MTNVLKKITVGNPLANFHLWNELDEYESITTDEQLAAFYHKILNKYEDKPLICRFIFAMISYSIGHNVDTKVEAIL